MQICRYRCAHTHTCTLGDIHLTHPHTSPASSLCIDMTAGLKRNAPALASVVAEAKVSSPKHNPDGQYPPLTPEAQIFTLRAGTSLLHSRSIRTMSDFTEQSHTTFKPPPPQVQPLGSLGLAFLPLLTWQSVTILISG